MISPYIWKRIYHRSSTVLPHYPTKTCAANINVSYTYLQESMEYFSKPLMQIKSYMVTVFKCLRGMAPDYLSTMCHPVSRLPGRQNLRSANRGQLDVPRATLSSCGVWAFAHAGPSLWNTLPVHLKNRNLTLTTFMSYLFSQYWFRIERIWGVIT